MSALFLGAFLSSFETHLSISKLEPFVVPTLLPKWAALILISTTVCGVLLSAISAERLVWAWISVRGRILAMALATHLAVM